MDNRHLGMKLKTHYKWEHFDKDGNLKAEGEFDNLVTTEGLNRVLDATFKTGLVSPAWFIGLVDGMETPTYAVSDTIAVHSGWEENAAYDEYADPGRSPFVPGDIADGAVDNTASRAVFTINANGTVAGFFLADQQTGTEGVLYGVGTFTSGSRPTFEGDTLRVTTTISA